MIVEAAGFEADTPEERAKVGPKSVLRLSDELELTGLFTESNTLTDLCRGTFLVTFKAEA